MRFKSLDKLASALSDVCAEAAEHDAAALFDALADFRERNTRLRLRPLSRALVEAIEEGLTSHFIEREEARR